jgi:hypothetical protein
MSLELCCHLNGIPAFMINNLQFARPTQRSRGSASPENSSTQSTAILHPQRAVDIGQDPIV